MYIYFVHILYVYIYIYLHIHYMHYKVIKEKTKAKKVFIENISATAFINSFYMNHKMYIHMCV